MVAHHLPHRRRDILGAASAQGIDNSGVTLGDVDTSTGGLAIATGATGGSNDATNTDAFRVSTTIVGSTSPSSATTSQISPSFTAAQSLDIPMGTVIGACVGAFAGAAILVLFGIWLYKRSSPSRDPVSANSRNGYGEEARSRSRLENWNKLSDGKDGDEDTWEGKTQMKETDIAPMEKLTMFKKSTPSIRTMYTHTDEQPVFDLGSHPFSQYHPNLAQEFASNEIQEPVKPFVATTRQESTGSWETGSGNESFLSLRSAMSPTVDMAIPTPALTSSEPHRWESAEVLDFTGQKAEIVDSDSENPFDHPAERRKSNNPFFGARESRTNHYITPPPPTFSPDKGKEREIVQNPFEDTPAPSDNNDRAIQSLIAALGVYPLDEDRLRVASMQTNATSDSMYSADMSSSFPTPPR